MQYRSGTFEGRQVAIPVAAYPYKPCKPDSDDIRLFEILPGEEHTQIQGKLRHYDLDDAPYFTALFYKCGDPSEWALILVDDVEFPVTVNLVRALRRLRARKCALLWVDAVCIHQSDNDEKNAQILKMNDIYHTADLVIVWLGLEGDGSEKLMRWMRDVEIACRPGKHAEIGPPPAVTDDLEVPDEVVLSFIQRSYWLRVWIIQEIALASQVMILCGDADAPWKGFEMLLAEIERENLFQDEQALSHLRHLCQTRSNSIQSKPLSLLQALYDTHASLATDPRDRVYALLGLAFDREQYVKRPQYRWTPEQVCLGITRTVIKTKRSLDIIFIGSEQRDSNLPSWCPNYLRCQEGGVSRSLLSYLSQQDERHRAGTWGTRWHATDDSIAVRDTFRLVDNEFLVLKGTKLASINGLGYSYLVSGPQAPQHTSRSLDDHEADPTQLHAAINGCLALYNQTYGMDIASYQDHALRLYYFLYKFDDYEFTTDPTQSDLKTRYGVLKYWRERNKNFMIRGRSFEKRAHGLHAVFDSGEIKDKTGRFAAEAASMLTYSVVSALTGVGSSMPCRSQMGTQKVLPNDLEPALDNLESLIREGLRLMTTDADHVGWVHPDAKLGDEIFLLTGCSMPAVLRPLHSTNANTMYTVVGHAYVDGIMNGEAWTQLDPGSLAEVWLV